MINHADSSDKLYWDDLTPGTQVTLGEYYLSKDEIIQFANRYDPLAFHVNPEQANATPIGQHCASGIHTMAILQRLTVDRWFSKMHIVAGMGVDKLRFIKPVLPDETLTGNIEVIRQILLPSTGHSDESEVSQKRGAVIYRVEAYNSQQQPVASMQGTIAVMCRPD